MCKQQRAKSGPLLVISVFFSPPFFSFSFLFFLHLIGSSIRRRYKYSYLGVHMAAKTEVNDLFIKVH